MDSTTANRLIEQSKQGDTTAFRRLVEEYQSMIYSLSFRLLCNEEDARDIVQDTFLRVWLNIGTFHSDKKFSTWIYSIASNLCMDRLKSSNHKTEIRQQEEQLKLLISSENIEEQLISSELCNIILALTEELTPKQKIVFTLRYLEDLEIKEIIEITGMTGEKIKSNLYLARQTIRQKLEKY